MEEEYNEMTGATLNSIYDIWSDKSKGIIKQSLSKPKKKLIWLDDCRDPFAEGATWIESYSPIGTNVDVIWLKSYDEFEYYIDEYGLPDAICFDHDLGDESSDEKNGYDCAALLVDYCMDYELDIPKFAIQSSNPSGAENIRSFLHSYHNHYVIEHNSILNPEYKNKK